MLSRDQAIHRAAQIMLDFAERTGLHSKEGSRRYLWTDAFAVCNFLALSDATGQAQYRALAARLIERVHAVLGRFRSDDDRHGWLSGLAEADGALHPTSGGLRIGKKLPEHDPLDGLLTCVQIRSTGLALSKMQATELTDPIDDFRTMLDLRGLATDDALGLGGLLLDLSRVVQLTRAAAFEDDTLLRALSDAAYQGLAHYTRQHDSSLPDGRRLAFRELGLSIGISCLDLVRGELRGTEQPATRARFSSVLGHDVPWQLASKICDFWLRPEHQHDFRWIEHHDINQVMLATSLIPESMLVRPIAFP